MSHSLSNIAKAFSHRNYRTYQGGRFISHMAAWMYKIAVGWIIWKLTYSTTWLGVFAFLDQLPALLIMPIAGALTDRFDALKMLRLTQVMLLIQGVMLAGLDYFGMLTLPWLIGLTLFHGVIMAFQLPANQTILPNLMPRDALTVAYGLNSVLFNIARFIGPMIAGITITNWGTAPAIFCNAIGAALFMGCLMILQTEFAIPKQARDGTRNVIGEIRDGFDYAWRHPGIQPMIVILSTMSLMPYCLEMLLPSLADGVYGMGANGLAWMTAAMGTGAMVQAALFAARGGVVGLAGFAVHAMLWTGIGFCVLMLANFGVALLCVFIVGFTASATRVSAMTLLQYSIEPHMRGRVASIYGMITHFVPAVGALLVGVLSDKFGMPLVMGIVGVYSFAIWAWAHQRRQIMAKTLEVDGLGPAPAHSGRH